MKFAVLGAGNSGRAQAADLALAGHDVNLYDSFLSMIKGISEKGGLEITGAARQGFAKLHEVTNDIAKAIKGVKVIFIATPAFVHEPLFRESTPYLEDGQIILINTGYYGCLRLARLSKELRLKKDIILSETSILVYSSRVSGPASVHVDGIKEKDLKIAALPARDTPKVLELLKDSYPMLIPATNVLECDLDNLNPCSHTSIMVLNAARIDLTKGDFLFLPGGTTPTVGKVIDAVDNERRKIAQVFGFEVESYVKTMQKYYNAKGETAYDVIQSTEAFQDPKERAPADFQHRYITEDIPYGLVPVSSLGNLTNVPTPTVDALIQLSSIINFSNYKREGVTLRKLGLFGLNIEQINEFLIE